MLALRLGKVDEARIALVHAAKAAGAAWPLPELAVDRLTVVRAKDSGSASATASASASASATGTGTASASGTATGAGSAESNEEGAGAADNAAATVIGVAHVTAYFNLARCLELAGDLAGAARLLHLIAAQHPLYTDAELRLAAIARARGDWAVAEARVRRWGWFSQRCR